MKTTWCGSAEVPARIGFAPRWTRCSAPQPGGAVPASSGWCSGTLDDGAAGLAAIAQRGGIALVQRPEDARFGGMPRAALAAVPEATEAPAAQLARLITELVGQPCPRMTGLVEP
jgi:hypothetical protein